MRIQPFPQVRASFSTGSKKRAEAPKLRCTSSLFETTGHVQALGSSVDDLVTESLKDMRCKHRHWQGCSGAHEEATLSEYTAPDKNDMREPQTETMVSGGVAAVFSSDEPSPAV